MNDGRKVRMRTHKCFLSALTLANAMAFGATAMAADLPKSGTYTQDYTAYGTAQVTEVGKERTLVAWDEHGLWRDAGFGDHVTWHCFGLSNVVSGSEKVRGYCVGMDPDGDQFVLDVASAEPRVNNAKTSTVKVEFTGGTGKYTGISGGGSATCHDGEFKTAAENSYSNYCANTGSYKIP